VLYTCGEARGSGARRGTDRGRGLWKFEFFQVWEEGAKEIRKEQQQPSDRLTDSGQLVLGVQENLKRSLQQEETDSHLISRRNPDSRWIRRRCTDIKRRSRSAKREGILAIRSGTDTRQPSDLKKLHGG
jgi:hypothetical protein